MPPSPTAAAQRLTEPERTSPAAKIPGRLVSGGLGWYLFAGAPAWQANKHQPSPLETSRPGIFAAGDVRSGSVKRCAAAVGEGGMAVAGIQMRLAGSN